MLRLHLDKHAIPVTHDGFQIGSSRHCDLKFNEPSIPFLHSLIHNQRGAIWIEAADENAILLVNDLQCRRMALRHGDRLKIGSAELLVDLGIHKDQSAGESFSDDQTVEELHSLTAEELCDRIATEQAMVQELSDGARSGWEALLHAIEAVRVEPGREMVEDGTLPIPEELVSYEALFEQIQELHETIVDRSRELEQKEAEVLASTSIIEESQQRVTQRLDKIIDHFNKADGSNELRASA
ncbi:MAG: FHA domain-containing protein [Schlesneria sp.]